MMLLLCQCGGSATHTCDGSCETSSYYQEKLLDYFEKSKTEFINNINIEQEINRNEN